ncbi:MAG: FHA domain-containing protein [Micrococcales bacterium]|nr:FHA domain-containing protein [Micrococcales bacterium]
MSSICPQGHPSASTDYCDICGSPMSAAAGGPSLTSALPPAAPVADVGLPPGSKTAPPLPGSAGSPGSTAQRCPNCGTVNVADALFCEACGYDFTTGVMPRPIALADGSYLTPVEPTGSDLDAPQVAMSRAAEHAEPVSDGPQTRVGAVAKTAAAQNETTENEATEEAVKNEDADTQEPRAEGSKTEDDSAEEGGAAADEGASAASPVSPGPPTEQPTLTDQPAIGQWPAAEVEPLPDTAAPTRSGKTAAYRPPSRQTAKDWVTEIWIDPDWYAVQDSSEPCPSPGVPEIVPLRDGALVGRPSASRSIRPDIDVGTDTGVSRRQAILSTDGHRWWVEDLDSSNGTFVGPASGPLPADPITSRVEVDADDRIYVGAWTRLVVRPATDSEHAGHG